MTATDRGIGHMRHCDRTSPVVETIRQDATGRARVCVQCQGCGRTDLDARLVDQLLDVDQDDGG